MYYWSTLIQAMNQLRYIGFAYLLRLLQTESHPQGLSLNGVIGIKAAISVC